MALILAGGLCVMFGIMYPVGAYALMRLSGSKKSFFDVYMEL